MKEDRVDGGEHFLFAEMGIYMTQVTTTCSVFRPEASFALMMLEPMDKRSYVSNLQRIPSGANLLMPGRRVPAPLKSAIFQRARHHKM
jgi:hypothetical protein